MNNKNMNLDKEMKDAYNTYQERMLSKNVVSPKLIIDISKPLTTQEVLEKIKLMK